PRGPRGRGRGRTTCGSSWPGTGLIPRSFHGGNTAMFSQTAEYALRAVVCLGAQDPRPLTTQTIAEQTQVPAGYLSKVLQGLGRAGLVESQRGLRGGFVLARRLDEISVLDVINAADPLRRIRSCPLGLVAHGVRLCPLHRRIDDTIALVESQ